MSSVLHPEIAAWKRSGSEDLDPEQVAREAMAEIEGALEGLYAIRELLRASSVSRSSEIGARRAGRSSETPPGHQCPGSVKSAG